MKTINDPIEKSIPVLVVEDDEGLNHLIIKKLRKEGLQADGVLTGKEAAARVFGGFQGVMLLDYQLPDMNGQDVVEMLAAKQKLVPFIIMTGHGDEKIAVAMMKLGARNYLVKDVDFIDALPTIVMRAVEELARERKLATTEKKLWQLEWLLKESIGPTCLYAPAPYGDLARINASHLLLDFVGTDLLAEIAEDYLQLMGTSGAIYEKNGDYALRILSSGWCGRLDQASRDLCGTPDNREAIASGKWLCHECCWTNASLVCIESGHSFESECLCGLRLYAVPIRAGKNIFGVMNFSFGPPPTDISKLEEISKNYKVDKDELLRLASSYEHRPAFIIDIAKKRLHTSANLVGEIIERKIAERNLAVRNRINEVFLTVPDDQMYADVLDTVLEIMGSPLGVFGYIDETGGVIIPSMTRHFWDQCQVTDKQLVFPRKTWGDSSWSRAILGKKTICKNEKSTRTPKGHIELERHISMPIQHSDEVIGLFLVANKKTAYTERDLEMLETIGSVVAPVLKARLEREKIFKELQHEKTMQAGATQVLAILNQPARQLEAVHAVINLIREFSGIEAVGLRLKDGENFPYYQATGFSREFVESEAKLCARDQDGGILRDGYGKPVLECMCGKVISGGTDPTKSFFTKGGSFWTNSTSDLLAAIKEEDWQTMMRNRCNREGYESVALIPLRTGAGVIGLLQLNDSRRNVFNAETIQFFERLAASIAVSLARRTAEADLLEAEKQLLQAQKMEAVGRLAGGVAHDFNNMLCVIIGYAGMALSSLDPFDPLYKELQEISKAGKRSADLTRQLLTFARKQIINPRVLNLNHSIESLRKMLKRLIGEDVEFVFVPGVDLWHVMMDPSQFDQILANLSVNSRDAIDGVGKITVETSNVVLDDIYCRLNQGFIPGEFVMLSFSDSGHGMDDQVREHIFEPFYTTKEEGKGTGLGLSTVYGIVKQSNGFINVYSEPGKGTTFSIYLPRILRDVDEISETTNGRSLAGTETVLIVEDEEQILELTRTMLRRLGYNVFTAATPGDACLLVEKYDQPIHLLLTDVIMPTMDGKELQQRIETLRPGIKTIFMSGYTADVIVHRGVLPEGIAFVQKPFSRETLARKIREVLGAGKPDPAGNY
ncbi:MAG: hypothetical protein A2521_05585 [Deltaproteobacteria bacterium RIFOXYD12_FULL_57_12]|nr:MAG: hypothetical protein A2521_05585 [Deltaproteobacteria bacterium RIFOXYD12_FULL_57_12]